MKLIKRTKISVPVETLLASIRVKPEKLLNNGFVFQHKTLFLALKDLLGNKGVVK